MDTTLRPRPDRKKKSPLALTVSVILHLAAGALLLRMVTLGISASQLGKIREKTMPIPDERLQYIRVAPGPSIIKPPEAPSPTPPSPTTTTAAPGAKALVAPTQIPQGVSAPVVRDTGSTAAGASGSGEGSGMERGAPVAARGVTPGYRDPRLWGLPTAGGIARSGTDEIDSVIVATLRSARDSADSAAMMQKTPGDWTKTDANGGRWGWDQQGIRLGKVTIPNALLGMLPLNAQRGLISNPIERDRNSRLSLMRDEILRNAARSAGEDDFKKAVKALRQRRDREREERLRLAAAAAGRPDPVPATPPPSAPDR